MRLQWRKYAAPHTRTRIEVLTTEDGTPITVEDKRHAGAAHIIVGSSLRTDSVLEFYGVDDFAAHGWAPHVERYTWEQARKLIDAGAAMRSPTGAEVALDGGSYRFHAVGNAYEFEPADFDGEWTVASPAPEPEPPAEDDPSEHTAPAPEPEPPAKDDPSTHTAPRPGVWYRVLPRSEQGALVARFPFCALLGRRLEYRTPAGVTGVIESYDYDLPEPCEFRVVEPPAWVSFYDADLEDFRGRRVEVVDTRSGEVIGVIENYDPFAAQVGRAARRAGVDREHVAMRVLD